MTTEHKAPISATLFIAPGCAHCANELEWLSKLVKNGNLGRLQVINAAVMTDEAAKRHIRSVPWLQLGEFEFEGALSEKELRHWIDMASRPDAMVQYFVHLLSDGHLDKVITMVKAKPDFLGDLIRIMENPDHDINARIGVSAVFESFQDSQLLKDHVDELVPLINSKQSSVRADAAHLLSLTGATQAVAYLKPLLEDENREVREIAQESLDELAGC